MLITILGPDGTGKTTLAKKLAEKVNDFEYIYFGYNKDSRSYRYFEDYIKSDIENLLSKMIRKSLVFINDLHYYNLAKHKNLVSDRCPIDSYIATRIRGSKMRFYFWLLSEISPKPDYVFLLEGDADLIFKRKEEISIATIELTVEHYKDYLDKHRIKNTCIDTTKNDIDETIRIALEAIRIQLK